MSEIRADKLHNVSGDNDSGLDLSTNDQVVIKTADTTAITVDASQNVSFAGDITVLGDDLTIGDDTGDAELHLISATDNSGRINFGDSGDADIGVIQYEHDGNAMVFKTNASERMRIHSTGATSFGTTDASPFQATEGHVVALNDGTRYGGLFGCDNIANRDAIAFVNPNGFVGSIKTNGSSTSYNTSSDARLKENVEDMTGAIDRVKQLLPKRFNFIADDTDTLVDGFLAHEAQSVVAEAVSGTHNEVDDDGNPVMQGIDQSKIVPLLTGALKEAIAKIEALEARITALENAE